MSKKLNFKLGDQNIILSKTVSYLGAALDEHLNLNA